MGEQRCGRRLPDVANERDDCGDRTMEHDERRMGRVAGVIQELDSDVIALGGGMPNIDLGPGVLLRHRTGGNQPLPRPQDLLACCKAGIDDRPRDDAHPHERDYK